MAFPFPQVTTALYFIFAVACCLLLLQQKFSSNGFNLFKFSTNLIIILGLDQRKKIRHYSPKSVCFKNFDWRNPMTLEFFKNLADTWSLLQKISVEKVDEYQWSLVCFIWSLIVFQLLRRQHQNYSRISILLTVASDFAYFLKSLQRRNEISNRPDQRAFSFCAITFEPIKI